MNLLDEAAGAARARGPRCTVHQLVGQLAGDVSPDEFLELVNSTVPATVASRILAKHSITIGYHAIQRHRRGDCQCR